MLVAVISQQIVVLDPRVPDHLGVSGENVPVLSLGDIDAIRSRRSERPCCRFCGRQVIIARWPGDRSRHYFRHAPGDLTECLALGGGEPESPEHEELKLSIAMAAKKRGHSVDVEVPGDGCRADVVATTKDGRRVPFEAQLASLSEPAAVERNRRYESSFGSRATWVHTGRQPWDRAIPSLQVDHHTRSMVGGGVYVDLSLERQVEPFPLDQAVGGICGRRLEYIYGQQDGGFGGFYWRVTRPKVVHRRRRNLPTGDLGQVLCVGDDPVVAAEAMRRQHLVDSVDGRWDVESMSSADLCEHCGERPRSSFNPLCIECVSQSSDGIALGGP